MLASTPIAAKREAWRPLSVPSAIGAKQAPLAPSAFAAVCWRLSRLAQGTRVAGSETDFGSGRAVIGGLLRFVFPLHRARRLLDTEGLPNVFNAYRSLQVSIFFARAYRAKIANAGSKGCLWWF